LWSYFSTWELVSHSSIRTARMREGALYVGKTETLPEAAVTFCLSTSFLNQKIHFLYSWTDSCPKAKKAKKTKLPMIGANHAQAA